MDEEGPKEGSPPLRVVAEGELPPPSPPQEMKMNWCWLGIHSWTKWKDHVHRNVVEKQGDTIPVRRILIQLRECTHCGQKDSRQLTV